MNVYSAADVVSHRCPVAVLAKSWVVMTRDLSGSGTPHRWEVGYLPFDFSVQAHSVQVLMLTCKIKPA